MDFKEKTIKKLQAGQAFRPGTPIDRAALFAGRHRQINEIVRAIGQTGQHVAIFGERGVGKTSLSRVLIELMTNAGIDVISPDNINCDGTDDFASIWIKVFRELFALLKIRNRESAEEVRIHEEDVSFETPDDIRFVLSRLPKATIIILDEVDRINNPDTTTMLADTIKNLSDHATRSTIILIGVADSIDELIREHQSVERALVQVHLPRMSAEEIREILSKGISEIDMTMDKEAEEYIIQLSAGLPHYAHTLALYATEAAIDNERKSVNLSDVDSAISQAVEKPGSLLSAYERATQSSRQTLYKEVLLACALAAKSDQGYFSAASVRDPLERIMGRRYEIPAFSSHLDAFCSEERGMVLQKSGLPRQYRFRFTNPLLQPFVIIHGLSKGLLSSDALRPPLPTE
jgi:Cdc6-like AAA superfamily ATPase